MKYLLLVFASLVFFFPTYWLFEPVVGQNWGAGIAAVAMYLAFPIIGLLWIDRTTKEPDSMLKALHGGTLNFAEHNVYDAITIVDYASGLNFYLLAIDDGKTLVLNGEYCNEQVKKGLFPSSRIRLYWDKSSLKTYGVEPIGNRILVSNKIEANTLDIDNKGCQLKDRDIFKQTLSHIASSIIHRILDTFEIENSKVSLYMTKQSKKIWAVFVILPFVAHLVQVYRYAYGQYDGEHCAGLLDAVPKCTEFEYYIDYTFGFLSLVNLISYYLVAVAILLAVWLAFKVKSFIIGKQGSN